MGEAVLGMVVKAGEEVAEQQGAGHVGGKGRPWPFAGAVRDGLGQPDPGERTEHSTDVDRGDAPRRESDPLHLMASSLSTDVDRGHQRLKPR